MPDSTITLRTRADLAALLETGKSFNVLSKEEQQAEKAALSLAQSMARLDTSLKNPAEGAARLRAALANATYIDPSQGVAALNQIVSLEQKAANEAARLGNAGGLQILPRTVESFGTQAIDQFKSGLLGIVGPAALVTGGITLATQAVQSFEDAFKFKAQLDQNTASITAQLSGIRDSKQAFQEAAIFADKYKLTQEETTTAIQASVPLLRQSKSSLTDVLTVLSQLQVLKPEQGIQGAAFALAELQGGQSRSLATRFNIPIAKATEMKNEIQKGADAVQVLGKYLNDAGIGAAALEVRTHGAAGAMNTLAVEQERLKIAQADLASGPGIAVLNLQTRVITGLTRVLGGSGGLSAAISNSTAEWHAGIAQQHAYNDALDAGLTRAQAAAAGIKAYQDEVNALTSEWTSGGGAGLDYANVMDASDRAARRDAEGMREATDKVAADTKEKIDAGIETQKLADFQAQLNADSLLAAKGLLGSGDQALLLANKYHYTADEAQYLIDKQAFLAGQGSKKVTPVDDSRSSADAQKRADAVHQSEVQLSLTRAKTSSQKIAILQKELSGTTDVIKRNELLGRIESEKNSAAKGYTSELNKQLTTQESIYDSLNKQRDAQISIQKLTAENTIKTLDEDKRLRSARAVLAKPEASADNKARAQATIDIINADRAQREQELRKQSATAGGTITDKGKLLQSVASNGAPSPGIGRPSPSAAGPPPVAPGAQPTNVAPQETPLILTMDGREVGKIVLPFLIDDLMTGVRQVRATKGA